MDFNKIVEFYEKIRSTKSRLEIIDIMSQMFSFCLNITDIMSRNTLKDLDDEILEDIKKIIYLTQGKLVPDFEDFPKLGIAEKMIIESMVKYTARSAKYIKDLINKQGDVGEAVEIILKNRGTGKKSYSLDVFGAKPASKDTSKKKLDVSKLYENLLKISQIKGAGSIDKKRDILLGLLRLCTPETAKYVLNIIIGKLRIGLADKTIMDGITKAVLGSKDKRHILENAYNLYPDLGCVSIELIKGGIKSVKNIQIKIGRPIQMMLASRIQYTEIQKKLGGGDFIAEYKYDGERVQVHKDHDQVKLYSRQLKNITDQYPDVVKVVKESVTAETAIFEGEVVAMDFSGGDRMLPFQILSTRRRKYEIEDKMEEVPICLFCFDILYHNGKNVMSLPLLKRRGILETLIDKKIVPKNLRISDFREIHTTAEMVEYFNQSREDGAEGIMNKSITEDSFYKAGNRGFLWIKLKGLEGAKMLDTIDVAIVGGNWGKGRNKGYLTPLFGAVWNDVDEKFEFLTRIGSGLSEDDLENFTTILRDLEVPKKPRNVKCSDKPDVWITPKIVIEVMGDELTVSNKADAGSTVDNPDGYGLRFPVYQRTRDDKNCFQITTSEEIIKLFLEQS